MPELTDLQHHLAQHIDRWTAGKADSDFTTLFPDLGFFRREAVAAPSACIVEPSVVLVVQGVKQLHIGGKPYRYDTERLLVMSLELPAYSEVVTASPEVPCLGLTLKLDLRVIAELIAQGNVPRPRDWADDQTVAVGPVTTALLEPFGRLVELLDEPAALSTLAPLIQREIHYRLLTGELAARLWQIVSMGSRSHQIARALDWLKVNYALPLRIDDLAVRAQMSSSTFHHHFRQLTAMSPLQYQKWLRLNEARRLMLNDDLDVGSAAFKVGYESPSQFSREYSRLFGAPPKKDVEQLRRASMLEQRKP